MSDITVRSMSRKTKQFFSRHKNCTNCRIRFQIGKNLIFSSHIILKISIQLVFGSWPKYFTQIKDNGIIAEVVLMIGEVDI